MPPMTQEQELTVSEVAQRLRVSSLTVIRRIQSGKLRARKEGGEWRIRQDDLQTYIDSTYYQKQEDQGE